MAHTSRVGGGSQRALRSANQRRIMDALSRRGELTQANIARATGLAASTVSNIVTELAAAGFVERKRNLGGPHGQLIGLVPPPGYVLGIEIGHEHLTLAIANLARELVAEDRIDRPRNRGWRADLAAINALIAEHCSIHDIDRADLLLAGLALPAPVDLAGTRVSSPDVMPGWGGLNAKREAEAALGVPVLIDNDANLGAIGEQVWGAAQDVDDLVYVKLSGGIGAGLVLGGRLYRGADGSAGEIGHTTVDPLGAVCRCGNRGCLETVASTRAMTALLRPVLGEAVTIEQAIAAAHRGNVAALRVLEDAGRTIGTAVANLVNTVNPRAIVLGGPLAAAGDPLVDPLRIEVQRFAVRGATRELEFRVSTLGVRSHVLGAISSALARLSQSA